MEFRAAHSIIVYTAQIKFDGLYTKGRHSVATSYTVTQNPRILDRKVRWIYDHLQSKRNLDTCIFCLSTTENVFQS